MNTPITVEWVFREAMKQRGLTKEEIDCNVSKYGKALEEFCKARTEAARVDESHELKA